MSIVKDLVLILMFVYLIVKCILLYRYMLKQREYFIETLSHDLRVSAIAQLRGLDLLLKNSSCNDSNFELINEINNSCKFTLEMMTMLLNSYKFEEKEAFLNYNSVALDDIVKNVTKDLESEASGKSIKFNFKFIGNSFADVDENEMNKVVYLILSTAVSNSQKNSLIDIIISSDNKKCKMQIIYKGLSLTNEEYGRMFFKKTRFSTVGHGIKMHLCKKIIDFHRGKISFEKLKMNKNSFSFEIPKRRRLCNVKSIFISTLQPNKL